MLDFAKFVGIAGLLISCATAFAADNHAHEGRIVHLDPVVPALQDNGARHEVVELFWYGCSHCFDFEPLVKEWKQNKADDINFVRVPAIFNARWEQHARAYYALEQMGELEKGHALLFSGIHEQGRNLRDLDAMARYFATHEIDETKFRESFNSFVVETKINRAKQLLRQYKVTGVPTIVIDGEYKTSAKQAGGYAQVIDIINEHTAAK